MFSQPIRIVMAPSTGSIGVRVTGHEAPTEMELSGDIWPPALDAVSQEEVLGLKAQARTSQGLRCGDHGSHSGGLKHRSRDRIS